jgi:hypothetical protein
MGSSMDLASILTSYLRKMERKFSAKDLKVNIAKAYFTVKESMN